VRQQGLARLSRIDRRKQIIEPTLLDVNAVVFEMRGMLERLIGEDVKVSLVLRPQPGPAPSGTETILVVEDAAGLRELAKRLLERQGYTVLLAADAAEALGIFDAAPTIHILLTDVVMPGASGPELTRQLTERQPGLKVIYMSGYTEDAITHHGVLNPGIDFIHKPFTSATLSRKIRDVLDR
jgi:CheY-like chemotaxis protein